MQTSISTSTIKKFLIWAYGIGWFLMIFLCYFSQQKQNVIASVFSISAMFAPSIAALLSKAPIKEVGWRPNFIKKWKSYAAVWLWLAFYVIFGAVVYFAIFPQHFSLAFSLLAKSIGTSDLALVQSTAWQYVFNFLTWINLLCIIPALGEELGWRGVLYPYLKERYGRTKGRIIGGLIWASWHLPILLFADKLSLDTILYIFPYYIMAITMGFLLDIYYVKSKSIWLPAFGHSTIDTLGPLTSLLVAGNVKPLAYLGPGANGLFVGLLALVVVTWLTKREAKEN